jgi:hypothetical protein
MDARDYLLISDQFMWSDSADYEKPTTVTIPPTEKSCLMFYVSLCDTCILKIPNLNHTFTSTTQHNTTNVAKEYVVYSWQSRRLNLKLNERTLTLVKEKTDNDTKGYWGIDIRECPEILDDKVIYRTQITDKNQTNQICQIMSPVGERSKRHAPAKQQKERSECKEGKLGPPHCDVSCETVLGPKYKFCEEHRICENTKCTCAWGYTGLRCNTLCENGKWGLSCEESCQSGCEKCDKVTGICRTGNLRVIVGSVTASVLVLSLIIIITTRRHNLMKCRKPRFHEVSTENMEPYCSEPSEC